MATAGKHIINIFPVLKEVYKQGEKLTSQFAHFGLKAGMSFGRSFADSFKISAGSLMADAIKNAFTGAQDKINEVKPMVEQNMTRDQKISRRSKQYGIDPSKLDALMRLGQSYGVNEDTTLSSLDEFRKKIMSGELRISGKDILEKYYNAMNYAGSQTNQAKREGLGEQLLGGGMQDVYLNSSQELKDRMKQLGFTTDVGSLKLKNDRINKLAQSKDNVDIDTTKTEMVQQNSVERNPKTAYAIMTYELPRQTQALYYINDKIEDLIKKSNDAYSVMITGQKAGAAGLDLVITGTKKVVEVTTNLAKAVFNSNEIKKKNMNPIDMH